MKLTTKKINGRNYVVRTQDIGGTSMVLEEPYNNHQARKLRIRIPCQKKAIVLSGRQIRGMKRLLKSARCY